MSSKTPDPFLEAWPSVVLDGGASGARRDVGELAASAASSASSGGAPHVKSAPRRVTSTASTTAHDTTHHATTARIVTALVAVPIGAPMCCHGRFATPIQT